MANVKTSFLDQLNQALELYAYTLRVGKVDPDLDDRNYAQASTAMLGVIYRVAGPDSIYMKQADGYMSSQYTSNAGKLAYAAGVVTSLRDDVANGYLDSVKELIHGELFDDFLEMSDFLLGGGYKDAAAVMAGGVIESHLRQLCIKHGIDVLDLAGKPRNAAQFNEDLYKSKVYSMVDQKNITAWLDIRNKAAHAKYQEYTKDHVSVMILGIRGLVARCPA